MQEALMLLEAQIQTAAPSFQATFNQGASEHTLKRAEAWLSVQLPEEFKVLYRLHDGQHSRFACIDGWSFFSLQSLCFRWLFKLGYFGLPGHTYNFYFPSPNKERYPSYWHPYWIPFLYHRRGSVCSIDLAPGPKGTYGQILFENDYDSHFSPFEQTPSIHVIAPSLEAYIGRFARDLQQGLYRFDEESNSFWSRQGETLWREHLLATKRRTEERPSLVDQSLTWEQMNQEYQRCFSGSDLDDDDYLLFEERIVSDEYPGWTFPFWKRSMFLLPENWNADSPPDDDLFSL